jgi:hypothetical protein
MSKNFILSAIPRFFWRFLAFIFDLLPLRVRTELPRWGMLDTACGPIYWSRPTHWDEHAFLQALGVPLLSVASKPV